MSMLVTRLTTYRSIFVASCYLPSCSRQGKLQCHLLNMGQNCCVQVHRGVFVAASWITWQMQNVCCVRHGSNKFLGKTPASFLIFSLKFHEKSRHGYMRACSNRRHLRRSHRATSGQLQRNITLPFIIYHRQAMDGGK